MRTSILERNYRVLASQFTYKFNYNELVN
jgi:hypothetical protein